MWTTSPSSKIATATDACVPPRTNARIELSAGIRMRSSMSLIEEL